MALRQLRQLAEAAGKREARHGMAAQVFERAADEIAHVDERRLRQPEEALDGGLRGRAGRRREVIEAGGARHVDAALDGMNPGGAGIGNDDAGGAEDGETADDAEPRIERLRRQRRAAGDGDGDGEIRKRPPGRRLGRGERGADHARAAPGLIAGSPTASGSPGRVTVPTPSPA